MALELGDRSLGALFPGLAEFGNAELPFLEIDAPTRTILQRGEIRTWEELASWTPSELAGIHNMSEISVRDVIRVCVEQLAVAEASHGDGEANRLARLELPDSATREETGVLRQVTDLLQLLAAWAVRERDFTRIGELLDLTPEAMKAKGQVQQTWKTLVDEPIFTVADSELVQANLDNLAATLLGELSLTELAIYQARLMSNPKPTLEQVGQSLGITRERVRQIQAKLEEKIDSSSKDRRFLPLLWRASDLGSTLSLAAPADSEVTSSAFRLALRGCKNEDERLASLLLRFAGPYRLQNGWYLKVGKPLPNWAELKELADENGIIHQEQAYEWFHQHRINLAFFDDWLDAFTEIRHIGESLAIWSGSVVDKCAALLATRGAPADAETLVAAIGEGHSVRGTRQRLFEDARFMRVSKSEWALRSWPLEEYSGIADEIAQRVKEQGGRARLSELMEEIPKLFKVSKVSVRAYAEAPMFVLEAGWVRLRQNGEPYSQFGDELSQARGVFRCPDGRLNMLIPVDREVLRGSGRQCPPALAIALGAEPGASRTFAFARSHHLAVTWPVTGLGPALGSTRPLAEAVHCIDGELLRLTFNHADSTVDASRIPRSEDRGTSLERLSLLTGLNDLEGDPAAALADAIGVPTSSLRATLRERGDTEIASLLPGPPENAALDAALSDLARLLHDSG